MSSTMVTNLKHESTPKHGWSHALCHQEKKSRDMFEGSNLQGSGGLHVLLIWYHVLLEVTDTVFLPDNSNISNVHGII